MEKMPHIKPVYLICLIVLLFFGCSKKNSADEDRTATTVSDSMVVSKSAGDIGMSIYKSKCAACHGDDGAAGIAGATNLQISQLTEEAIQLTIANGRGRMPSFGAGIPENEIKVVAAYVKTLKNK